MSLPIFGREFGFRKAVLKGLSRLFRLFQIRFLTVKVNDLWLVVDPRDAWSLRAYFFYPAYDRLEIRTIQEAIGPDYTFVDVGGNFGAWTFALAPFFSRAILVEPEKRCIECCQRTLARCRFQNVTLVQAALSDQEGEVQLYPSDSCLGDGRIYHPGDAGRKRGEWVRMTTFDALMKKSGYEPKHLFVKLDVQGAEPGVLRGMKHTLEQVEDLILWTEVTESTLAAAGSGLTEYLELLKSSGFVPVDLFQAFRLTSWEAVVKSSPVQKDYCFRFVRARVPLYA